MLDAAHCERPRSTYMHAVFGPQYAAGFRAGFARYGALLDTIEYAPIGGFPYMAVRPLGAPPDAKGTPPKLIFKLLVALHPALRKRCKRATEVFVERPWRTDIATFWREAPAEEARIAALADVDQTALDDAGVFAHWETCNALVTQRVLEHFSFAPATMVPVGDFLAHVQAWTGAPPSEALIALRGHSPASTGGTRAMIDAAVEIAASSEARAVLGSDRPAVEILATLRAMPAPVGPAVEALLGRYGDVVISGHDIVDLSLAEMPGLAVATLRAQVKAPPASDDARATSERVTATLRERVPTGERARFDELLADARAAYPLRDARTGIDFWAIGVLRRSALTVGERLVRQGRLQDAAHVFECTPDEVRALTQGKGPTAAALASRAKARHEGVLEDAPAFVGGTPGEPPPADWLPAGAARVQRAVGVYLDQMSSGVKPTRKTDVVSGLGASPGKKRGRARLVRSAADFERLEQGDILIAPITTPVYNVILPLLGGVVTDRGGLLSHPAIVSREYGFPAVVGAGDATSRIPDGAMVELDGDAGTVRVIA
jgi:pyruvate,water dikinase